MENVGAQYPMLDPQYDTEKAEAFHFNVVNKKLPSLEKERLEILSKEFEPNTDWWGSKVTKD